MSVDRRTFLEGAAATAAVGAMATVVPAGVALADEAEEESPLGTPIVPGYTCFSDWLGQPPEIDPSEIVATYDTEVLVVGGGHAGSQCALAAAECGAQVMVLEMQALETYSAKGGDVCTFNSKILTDRGFGGYDTGAIVADYVHRGGQTVQPALVSSFVMNSGEMLDHLAVIMEGTGMFDFEGENCQVQQAYGCPDASYYPVELGGFKMWASCLETMGTASNGPIFGHESPVSRLTEVDLVCAEKSRELGAQWFYETEAIKLVQNEDGDVTGVIAEGPDGLVQFNASKGVAMTTGDFSGDAKMIINLIDHVNEMDLRAGFLDPKALTTIGVLKGTGHKMMCWAGGYIEGHPRPSLSTIMAHPGPWGSTPYLLLNAQGKRFMNEAQGHYTRVCMMHQPHGIVASITDANYMQSIRIPACDHGCAVFGPITDKYLMPAFEEAMEALVSGPEPGDVPGIIQGMKSSGTSKVYKADTIEDLLTFIGYEGEAYDQALKSIEAYNEMCHNGCDSQYGKDAIAMVPIETPPFYAAIRMETGTCNGGMATFAGMVADDHFNVLQADGTTPIKGLYVAGNTLGNRFGTGYNTPTAGSAMGMALTHGRMLGKYLAAL